MDKELLTINEAADLLSLKKSTIYKLTHKKAIPHYKFNGKSLYFKRQELIDMILSNRVSTNDEIDRKAIEYVVNNRTN